MYTAVAFNVPTAGFNPCFGFYAPNHGVGSFPHNKYQNNIAENNKKFIEMKQIQDEGGGGKTWFKRSNKKVRTNKSKKQNLSNKKANLNGYTKINNGVHLVYGK